MMEIPRDAGKGVRSVILSLLCAARVTFLSHLRTLKQGCKSTLLFVLEQKQDAHPSKQMG